MADLEEHLTLEEEACMDRIANLICEDRKERQAFQKHLLAH